ncbi:hypothetical protein J6590_029628 [Homalodisca vitripennis]|nr:hypothetical protein J6590_029628 [Homalodisca vitripennis]
MPASDWQFPKIEFRPTFIFWEDAILPAHSPTVGRSRSSSSGSPTDSASLPGQRLLIVTRALSYHRRYEWVTPDTPVDRGSLNDRLAALGTSVGGVFCDPVTQVGPEFISSHTALFLCPAHLGRAGPCSARLLCASLALNQAKRSSRDTDPTPARAIYANTYNSVCFMAVQRCTQLLLDM